jgi:hypothetical protein
VKTLAIVAAVAGLTGSLTARQSPEVPGVSRYLSEQFGIAANEVVDLNRRRPVVRTLQSTDNREIVSLGLIQMAAEPARYVERLRAIATFKRSERIFPGARRRSRI